MTIKYLYELCKREIKNGNGDRDIVLCINYNEFYPLENQFSSPINNDNRIYDVLDEWNATDDEVIVLN